MLDAFLKLAGVNLKRGRPRSDAELVLAAIVGADGLRAARDGKAELSPGALAAVRLIATYSAEVRGPRPAAIDRRHGKRSLAGPATATFEAARVRVMHDLLAGLPGASERLPPHLLEMLDVFADPEVFERMERMDAEAVEPLYADFEQATIELLDTWRLATAGGPAAQAAVALAERRFARAIRSVAEHVATALRGADA